MIDDFESTGNWTTPEPGLSLSTVNGTKGNCIALDYNLDIGKGWVVISKNFPDLEISENDNISFYIKGESPDNNLEFKLVDSSGNTFLKKWENYHFPEEWRRINVRYDDIEYGWGPDPSAKLSKADKVEFVIANGTGSSGKVFIDELKITSVRPGGYSQRTNKKREKSKDEWETYFMPGFQYSYYTPRDSSKYGIFQGASVEFLIGAWVHKNENRGPSHGRVFFNLDLLNSDRANVKEGLLYSIGIDLSFERNAKRKFLIPYFGLKYGGFYQETTGYINHFTPFWGLHIYVSRNLFINLTGGYLYPLDRLEELRGWHALLGLDFSMW